jgi:hypothetical protein
MIRSLTADPGSQVQPSYPSGRAETSQARRPHSPPTAERRHCLAKNHAGSPTKILLRHAGLNGCMHEHTDQLARTRLQSQTRSEKLVQGRSASIRGSLAWVATLSVQVQYIPAFRGGSWLCMYYCTVSDCRMYTSFGGFGEAESRTWPRLES